MTKYILHGGDTSYVNLDNDSFFAEITKDLNGKIKILLNYFARRKEEIEKCTVEDKERLLQNSVNKYLEFEIADENNLGQQIKNSNVMYIRGGNTAQLVEKMKKIDNLEELFIGKVIAGSSAGTYVLCKYYWENNNETLGEGLGVFKIKCLGHYDREVFDAVEKLKEYKENLPILTLPNYKWVVFYK